MGLLDPTPPPYDPIAWQQRPLDERGRMVCEAWAAQGYGTPPGVFAFYAAKLALYLGAWVFFCGLSPSLGGVSSIASWALHPLAFQKAIVWSLLFEVLGLGCGSGPLSGRYLPPIGGFLYFLRPGTTRLPLFPGLPLIGAPTRSLLDVALYLGLVAASLRALVAPSPELAHFLPIVLLLAALGVLDKTIFLAARAEHYWVTLVCFVATPHWIAGAQAVQLALWFWAGVSKLNHHFPTVVCVMTSNGPLTRFPALRRRMYRDPPSDLRPSRLATVLAHAGTALELGVPIAFLLTPLGTPPVAAVLLMLALHGYITSNVPMGVPIEWNFPSSTAASPSSGRTPRCPSPPSRRSPSRPSSRRCSSRCPSSATSSRRASPSSWRCATTRATGPGRSGSSAATRTASSPGSPPAARGSTTSSRASTIAPPPWGSWAR
jgi:hypothetical protein